MRSYDITELVNFAEQPDGSVSVEPIRKGRKHGECNRTACSNPDARWYNPHTNGYYCEPCARLLNEEMRWANLRPLWFS